MGLSTIVRVVCVLATSGTAAAAGAADVVIDFRDKAQVARCAPEHDVSETRASAEGMEIAISGADPFIAGPMVDLPASAESDTRYLLELKLKSEQGGMVEVFYFPAGGHAAAGR